MANHKKIIKIGNSLGLTLPAEMVRNLDLHHGDSVLVDEGDFKITKEFIDGELFVHAIYFYKVRGDEELEES